MGKKKEERNDCNRKRVTVNCLRDKDLYKQTRKKVKRGEIEKSREEKTRERKEIKGKKRKEKERVKEKLPSWKSEREVNDETA